jgi:hypothetical protein
MERFLPSLARMEREKSTLMSMLLACTPRMKAKSSFDEKLSISPVPLVANELNIGWTTQHLMLVRTKPSLRQIMDRAEKEKIRFVPIVDLSRPPRKGTAVVHALSSGGQSRITFEDEPYPPAAVEFEDALPSC